MIHKRVEHQVIKSKLLDLVPRNGRGQPDSRRLTRMEQGLARPSVKNLSLETRRAVLRELLGAQKEKRRRELGSVYNRVLRVQDDRATAIRRALENALKRTIAYYGARMAHPVMLAGLPIYTTSARLLELICVPTIDNLLKAHPYQVRRDFVDGGPLRKRKQGRPPRPYLGVVRARLLELGLSKGAVTDLLIGSALL